MTNSEATTTARPVAGAGAGTFSKPRGKRIVLLACGVALIAAMVLDTKVVRMGSTEDLRQAGFSPEAFGIAEFPRIKTAIEARAVDADVIYAAIATDKQEAITKYAVPAGSGPVFSVKFAGIAGTAVSGVYEIKIESLPELKVRVQTGPAINGTELRDATGTIEFGQFTNQIEYQNAGSALNNRMKAEVLAAVDTTALSGKKVAVVGSFRLINPKSWLVTPVRLEVQ